MSAQRPYRVVVTDYAWPNLAIEESVLNPAGADVVHAGKDDHAAMLRLAPTADAVLVNWNRFPADIIRAAEKCVVIVRYGVGVDNIDIPVATELGIPVCNVPDYCMDEVSNEAMAMLLTGARRSLIYDRSVRSGVWDVKVGMPMARLQGQTLGIIGFGRIGRAVAPKALGFGLRVLAYDPYIDQQEITKRGCVPVDFATVLRESDYLTIHTPLTPETTRLIDAAALAQMKPSAWLINTARGPIVDTLALAAALKGGKLAGAGLDVLPEEPPAKDDALFALPNVVLSPHSAFYSEGSLVELLTKASTRVAEALRGDVPATVLNRPVLEQANSRLQAHRQRLQKGS